jgi:hypothetical protein
MAYEVKGKTISLKAAAEVTKENKFKPVKISADDTFAIAGNEDTVVGVIQNECKAGEAGQVMIEGITMYKATATIAAGAAIGTWGIAVRGGVQGDIIPVLIK